MRVFQFVKKKKRKRALRPISFFFNDSYFFLKYFNSNHNHFFIKKKEKGPETGFLLWFWHIFKYLNSNHNLPSYSLFSNVFRGYFILVYIGVLVFFRGFIFHSSSRAWLALALALRLPPFDRKTLKNCASSADPGLLNETKG